jgi:hypothetical protein
MAVVVAVMAPIIGVERPVVVLREEATRLRRGGYCPRVYIERIVAI